MLVKKKELAGEITGADVNIAKMQKYGFLPIIDMKEHLDKLAHLQAEIDNKEGWTEMIKEERATAYIK